jgi:hypothetical protein
MFPNRDMYKLCYFINVFKLYYFTNILKNAILKKNLVLHNVMT